MTDNYDYTSTLLESIEAWLEPNTLYLATDSLSESSQDLNEDSYITFDWVSRIKELLNSHKLKPNALEEFIKKYEDQDDNDLEAGMPLYSLNYDYENKLEDLFNKEPAGWIRTDMFKDYEYSDETLVQRLRRDRQIGYIYFIFEGRDSIVLIRGITGLNNWFKACNFKSRQDALDYLEKNPNNIPTQYVNGFIE